jgi:hypothetical protein
MASKPMQLKCKITLQDDRSFKAVAQMFDGTQFDLQVAEYDFKVNEAFLPSKRTVDGWIYVQQESQQGSRVYITLPKPSIAHGHHLTVHELSLMPRNASIDDFGAKKTASGAIIADTVDSVKLGLKLPPAKPPSGPNTGKSGKVKKPRAKKEK